MHASKSLRLATQERGKGTAADHDVRFAAIEFCLSATRTGHRVLIGGRQPEFQAKEGKHAGDGQGRRQDNRQ